MTNLEIRNALEKKRMRHYELAKALGIDETSLSRKLRYELPTEQKERILKLIKEFEF